MWTEEETEEMADCFVCNCPRESMIIRSTKEGTSLTGSNGCWDRYNYMHLIASAVLHLYDMDAEDDESIDHFIHEIKNHVKLLQEARV